MAKLYVLLLLLVSFMSTAQDKQLNYKQVEAKVKKYISSNPDSVRIIVDEALQYKNLNDTIKGNLYNIYGIYYGSIGKPDSSIVYYKKAMVFFKGYPKMMTRPLMNIANSYRNKGEYNESFNYLNQALDIAVKNGYKAYEANIYSNMSTNYQSLEQYDIAIDYGLKAIAMLKESDPGRQLSATLQRVANTYMKMHNFNFALDLYAECLQMFKKQGDNINYSLTLINYAECLKHVGQNKKALKALDEAITAFKKVKNTEHLSVAYSKVASIAVLQKNYKKAVENYDLALAIMQKSNSINATLIGCEYVELLNKMQQYDKAGKIAESVKTLSIYKNASAADKVRLDIAVAETYSKTDDDNLAIAGLQNAIKVKDSLNSVNSNSRAQDIQAKFQTEVQREKNRALAANNKLLQQDAAESRTKIIIYIAAVLAVIALVLLILRGYWLKNRLQKVQLKAAGTDVSLLHKQHEHEQQLTNAQREMIEEKQRELTSTALRMASYQDSISDIIQKCEAQAILKITDFKKELLLLVKQQDYWRQFETRFNSLHPDFSTNLQHRYSRLTKNDVEFCSLLKLNLSNKEIASLLQISHESAITKKYRIKKKMEINDDAEFEKLLMAI